MDQILLRGNISITEGLPVKVISEVVKARSALLRELQYQRNDPKVAVKSFTHNEHSLEIELATGILATDDKWSQRHCYTDHPLDAFSRDSGKYYARLEEGAYVHASTFSLVIGVEGKGDFDSSYVFLIEKKKGQQSGSLSVPNQGVEVPYCRKMGTIGGIPLTTESVKEAMRMDAAQTLDVHHLLGYASIGACLMPGSMDIGGVLVARIDAMKIQAKYETESEWKQPVLIPMNEVSEYVRQHPLLNSILHDTCLGNIIHNRLVFGDLYESALRNHANSR